MKYLLALLALLFSFSGYSQASTPVQSREDSSASCISYWKKGESKVYSIVREKNKPSPNGTTSPFTFAYEAWLSVIDSTANSYTIKWVFHLPAESGVLPPSVANSLPVYNGLQMIFKITAMGEFIELLNWEEVKDAYVKMMEVSLPQKMDSTSAAILESTKKMFNSKSVVESSLIKEIQLFHMPYGYKFTTTVKEGAAEIPNPFGGQAFPAIQTSQITELDGKKGAFTLVFNLNVDKANSKNMIDSLLTRMNIKANLKKEPGKEEFSGFDMHDLTEYHFIRSTGWISRVYYKRTIVMAGTTQSETITITLKD
jgi:hypothetical protein